MRAYFPILVGFIAIQTTSTAAEFSFNTPNAAALTQSIIAERHNRHLRAGKLSFDEVENEERGANAAGVESISNKLKSTVSAQQLDDWFQSGQSTDDLFKLLALDKAADDLLANSKLQTWIDYMKVFNTRVDRKQRTTLIKTLTAHYGDDGLARIIEAAKQVPATSKMAKQLQTEQIQRWIGQEKSIDDVFALLKLNKAGDSLFMQPQVLTWAKYVDDFNKAHPDKKATTLFSKLTKYDEQTLLDMLIAAEKVPSTKNLAVRVQADLTNFWLDSAKTEPDRIFALLRLDKVDGSLFEDPLFIAWMKYADNFNLMYPREALSLVTSMREHLSSFKLAKIIVEASMSPSTQKLANQFHLELLDNWLKSGNTPASVFKLLHLGQADGKLLENPIFTNWLKYVSYFREANPEQRVSVVSILKKHYNDDTLAKILVEADKEPSTKKLAAGLLDELTIRWMYNKKTPEMVHKWLRVDGAAEDDAIKKIYDTYARLYKMRMGY